MDTLPIALAIVLAAGCVSGLAGFGFALTSVPLLLLLYDPTTVVALSNILPLVSLTLVVAGQTDSVLRPTLTGMAAGAGGGLLVGIVLLRGLNDDALKLLASVVVIGFALMLAGGAGVPGTARPGATVLAGFGSGALNAATGLSGPPVVMLLSARRLAPLTFRVTLSSYFIFIDVITLAALAVTGLLRAEHLLLALALSPAAAIGTLAGRRLSGRIDPELFRRLTLAMLVLTGLIGAGTSLTGLLG